MTTSARPTTPRMKPTRSLTRNGWPRVLLVGFCSLVFTFLMLPLLIVFPLSVSASSLLQFPPPGLSWRWFDAFFASPSWRNAMLLSIEVGLATAILSTALGVPIAFFLARGRRRWLVWLVDKVSVTPMIVPSMVTAVSVYSLFSSWHLIGSATALVLGHTVLALPLMVIVVTAGLRQFDVTLEDAALGLGASQARAVFHVTLPLIRPSVLCGAFFAFMASFDDLVVALFLSGSNMTLPKKTFENIGYALDPTIAAVSALQIVFLLLVGALWYGVSQRMASRRGTARLIPGLVS